MENTLNIWHGTQENPELSNLAYRPFSDGNGREYISVEHAYQSLKSGEFDKETYLKSWSGGKKIIGKKGTRTIQNWNLDLMRDLIERSFEANPEAQKRLLETEGKTLTHTQDRGIWKTEFPRILSEIRQKLIEKKQNQIATKSVDCAER